MSHGDHVDALPPGFARRSAARANAPLRGDRARPPRRDPVPPRGRPHAARRRGHLRNFLIDVCGCEPTWTAESFIEAAIEQIREQVGDGRVLLGLSGGVDSSVAAALIHRAIGDQLTPVFVNNGLLRLGEAELVREVFARDFGMKLVYVDAARAVPGPAGRRHRPRGEAQDRSARRSSASSRRRPRRRGPFEFLAQGTLYPDVIESTTKDTKAAVKIKTHHNVGGLPEDMQLQAGRAAEVPVQGRGARGRPRARPAGRRSSSASPSPVRAWRSASSARSRAHDLDLLRRADAIVRERDRGGRADRRGLAVLRRAAAGQLGRRDGRLPHLRPGLRRPRRRPARTR